MLRNPCRELSSPDLLLQPEQSHTKAFSREAKIAALSLCPASRLLWARWHRPCAGTPSWQSPAAPSTGTGQRLGSLWGRGRRQSRRPPDCLRAPFLLVLSLLVFNSPAGQQVSRWRGRDPQLGPAVADAGRSFTLALQASPPPCAGVWLLVAQGSVRP